MGLDESKMVGEHGLGSSLGRNNLHVDGSSFMEWSSGLFVIGTGHDCHGAVGHAQ